MVITFVPYPDIKKSLSCLDDRRLGKQRVEAYQIIQALTEKNKKKKGWTKHPATLMWKGYENCLKYYLNECIKEWISREKVNNLPLFEVDEDDIEYPWWWGWEIFHQSHMCALIRKNPWDYEGFKSEIKDFMINYGYVWPSKCTEEDKEEEFDEDLAKKICAEINPLQLRPFCKEEGCRNFQKHEMKAKKMVFKKYCGVHLNRRSKGKKKKKTEEE